MGAESNPLSESVKRTAEFQILQAHTFQSSASRTFSTNRIPSAEALGYFYSVRFADGRKKLLQQTSPHRGGMPGNREAFDCKREPLWQSLGLKISRSAVTA